MPSKSRAAAKPAPASKTPPGPPPVKKYVPPNGVVRAMNASHTLAAEFPKAIAEKMGTIAISRLVGDMESTFDWPPQRDKVVGIYVSDELRDIVQFLSRNYPSIRLTVESENHSILEIAGRHHDGSLDDANGVVRFRLAPIVPEKEAEPE